MRIADVLSASASERHQLWDAAIWSVAVDGIEHMNGYGEQQLSKFIQLENWFTQVGAPQMCRCPVHAGRSPIRSMSFKI